MRDASKLRKTHRCPFALHLHVAAKHFNGSSRLSGYDYHETASFALSIV